MASTLALLCLFVSAAPAEFPWKAFNFLKAQGRIDSSLVQECSGLVQSLRYPDVFWALGDSGAIGDRAVLVPVTGTGQLAQGWSGPIRLEGLKNYDWEDLALDGEGNLIIADVGNNRGRRQQLMLHFIKEPKPGDTVIHPDRTLRVHYEDQSTASADYDCEAVFVEDGEIYFLTKRQSDKRTCLYRLDGSSTIESNPLRLVDCFDIGGTVTAADTSPNGKMVAVLTYTMLWVFTPDSASDNIFTGSIRRTPIFAWQAEAVAFHGNNSLVIGNEGGQLYRVDLGSLKVMRP